MILLQSLRNDARTAWDDTPSRRNSWCFFVSLYYWIVNSCFFDNIFHRRDVERRDLFILFLALRSLHPQLCRWRIKRDSACLCALSVSAVLFPFFWLRPHGCVRSSWYLSRRTKTRRRQEIG